MRCIICGKVIPLGKPDIITVKSGDDAYTAIEEIFCTECNRIEYGVEPEIYTVAKYFVEEFNFNIFPNNDDSDKTKQMNVAKVSEIIAWAYKNMGLLSARGFTIPIDISKSILGEDVIYRDDDISDVEVEIMDTGANVCR